MAAAPSKKHVQRAPTLAQPCHAMPTAPHVGQRPCTHYTSRRSARAVSRRLRCRAEKRPAQLHWTLLARCNNSVQPTPRRAAPDAYQLCSSLCQPLPCSKVEPCLVGPEAVIPQTHIAYSSHSPQDVRIAAFHFTDLMQITGRHLSSC
ncbi:hypothetical protein ACJQWK_02605 [Exserohilum turcicum]